MNDTKLVNILKNNPTKGLEAAVQQYTGLFKTPIALNVELNKDLCNYIAAKKFIKFLVKKSIHIIKCRNLVF